MLYLEVEVGEAAFLADGVREGEFGQGQVEVAAGVIDRLGVAAGRFGLGFQVPDAVQGAGFVTGMGNAVFLAGGEKEGEDGDGRQKEE